MLSIERNNMPEETDAIVHIKDVLIPKDYRRTKPKKEKIKAANRYFIDNNHIIDKPISVVVIFRERRPPKYLLIDKYARYIALVDYIGLQYIPVKYIDIVY